MRKGIICKVTGCETLALSFSAHSFEKVIWWEAPAAKSTGVTFVKTLNKAGVL